MSRNRKIAMWNVISTIVLGIILITVTTLLVGNILTDYRNNTIDNNLSSYFGKLMGIGVISLISLIVSVVLVTFQLIFAHKDDYTFAKVVGWITVGEIVLRIFTSFLPLIIFVTAPLVIAILIMNIILWAKQDTSTTSYDIN